MYKWFWKPRPQATYPLLITLVVWCWDQRHNNIQRRREKVSLRCYPNELRVVVIDDLLRKAPHGDWQTIFCRDQSCRCSSTKWGAGEICWYVNNEPPVSISETKVILVCRTEPYHLAGAQLKKQRSHGHADDTSIKPNSHWKQNLYKKKNIMLWTPDALTVKVLEW